MTKRTAADNADRAELAGVLASLEVKRQQDPTDGRLVLDALACCLEANQMPPTWAIERFVNAVLAYHAGTAAGFDAALKVPRPPAGEKPFWYRIALRYTLPGYVREYRKAHPGRGNAEASFKFAAAKFGERHGVILSTDAVKKRFQWFQRHYGKAKSAREMVALERANPDEYRMKPPPGRPRGRSRKTTAK
jgi:hypothetical protein